MAWNPVASTNHIIKETVGFAGTTTGTFGLEHRMSGTWLITEANSLFQVSSVGSYGGVRLVVTTFGGGRVDVLNGTLNITPLHCGLL